MIRTWSSLLALGFLLCGCVEEPDAAQGTGLLWRSHSVGTMALSRDTNATKLRSLLALPSSRGVREEVLKKLSKAPRELGRKHWPADAPDAAALVRPLLEDALAAESVVEIRGPRGRTEGVLAVQLADARAAFWLTTVRQILQDWKLGTPEALKAGGQQGWELRQKQTAGVVQCVRAGPWVVLGWGPEKLTLLPALVTQIAQHGRPAPALSNAWLEVEADMPRVGACFPWLAYLRLPWTHLTLSGQGENVLTEAKLTYAQPLSLNLEPWRVPTNLATEPLINFTVGRGVRQWLSRWPVIRDLGLKEIPNQFCLWGLDHSFPLTFAAWPAARASNVVRQLATSLPPVLDREWPDHMGHLMWASNRAALSWVGLPMAVPTLRPAQDAGVEYVQFEVFPFRGSTNPPPPELLGQVFNRPNLVYYDWEITGERLGDARPLLQLYDIANYYRFTGTNVVTQKWIEDLKPHLGNTGTEITQGSPRELLFMRRSHLGFTAFELVMLARWIESPEFPFKLQNPPRLRHTTGAASKSGPLPINPPVIIAPQSSQLPPGSATQTNPPAPGGVTRSNLSPTRPMPLTNRAPALPPAPVPVPRASAPAPSPK